MHWSLRLLWVWMLCLTAALPAAAATAVPAATVAIVTILDGDASLVRVAAKSPLAEGVRLQATDIVDSSDKARLVRLEFGNGTV
ncbi:MAG: hypothetical protein JWP52_4224, partial [Rhizobacter sp.]|nr:hypothetical protein [Rhizobacter sp.]